MKLLCYIQSLTSGGAERVLAKLANYWCAQGHDVYLVTNASTENDRYPLASGVTRLSLELPETSNNLVHALIKTWRRQRRLNRLVKQLDIECVVAFMAPANVIATMATRSLNVPVVISERVHPPFLELSRARWVLLRYYYPRATHLIVLSEQSKAWLVEHTRVTAISVIPNGVALPLPVGNLCSSVAPDTLVEAHQHLVLSVGRLVEQKQPEIILRTFAAQLGRDPSWRLALIGDGPKSSQLRDLSVSLGIEAQMIWLSHVSNVQDWYERADIYLSASQFEGSPNALMEAMACGCAAIAFDCPTGPGDIVRSGVNGILVAQNDTAELQRALARLSSDSELRARLSHAAMDVHETFSDTRFYRAWDDTLSAISGV